MLKRGGHLADASLLAYHDGEMSWMERGRVGRHLRGCAACREREAQVARAMAEILDVAGGGVAAQGVRAEGSRAMLRARMGHEMGAAGGFGFGWQSGMVVAMALVVVAGCFGVYGRTLFRRVPAGLQREPAGVAAARMGADGDASAKPDGRLTPGATRAVSLGEICPRGGEADQDPAVAPMVERTVFREYGMDGVSTGSYQVDYLISPGLGGTGELRNLWPEPNRATVWNARAKDALETRLHEMVCRREIDLRVAQEAIATDWILAYQRVFHTAVPG